MLEEFAGVPRVCVCAATASDSCVTNRSAGWSPAAVRLFMLAKGLPVSRVCAASAAACAFADAILQICLYFILFYFIILLF